MFTVNFCGITYPCNKAIKKDASATLVLIDGGSVEFTGVSDFSKFVFEDGAGWDFQKIRADKETELSAACNAAITAGMDVETSQGTEHFSLEETDQINLSTALSAVQTGAANYPYHADGKLCRMFTADEIRTIASAAISHTLYHRTLCNHLLTWERRSETAEELDAITYTAEGLPEDLASNMAQVLAAAQNV